MINTPVDRSQIKVTSLFYRSNYDEKLTQKKIDTLSIM